MKKQTNLNSGGHPVQVDNTTTYDLREIVESVVKEYGKQRVINEITKAAENSNAHIQRILGAMYDLGIVVEQNLKTAAHWYMKSAKQGYYNGQFAIGYAYYLGRGVKQSKSKARYWYRKAAKQGHTEAQCRLCKMYRSGDGVTKSMLNAFSWYESEKYAKLKKQIK